MKVILPVPGKFMNLCKKLGEEKMGMENVDKIEIDKVKKEITFFEKGKPVGKLVLDDDVDLVVDEETGFPISELRGVFKVL